MQFLIGVSFVAISACGGSGGGGGDDAVVPINNDNLCGTVVDIGPNSIIDGVLEAGDCRVSDFDPTSDDTSFIDEYRITVNSMAILTINMRSASIDSVLFLMNRSTSCTSGCTPADIITFDDDSGGGVNGEDALISMDLAPGTYLIGANSFIPGTGSYTLETSFRNPIGPYMIGQIGPAGGIVFYITNGGLNGLEAAPVDQSIPDAPGVAWGCNETLIAGADGTAVGSGAQNTVDILAGCLDTPIAAEIANGYTLNGFSDWFLPSRDELNELYLQKDIVGGFSEVCPDFGCSIYWSSSELLSLLDDNAHAVDFSDGVNYGFIKDQLLGVRAVRSF
jgi:hypothetical protein